MENNNVVPAETLEQSGRKIIPETKDEQEAYRKAHEYNVAHPSPNDEKRDCRYE